MNKSSFARAARLGLMGLAVLQLAMMSFAAPLQEDRIKPAKSKEKGVKRGTIEVKNDTGQDCNDFHLFFKPDLPTIEGIKLKGGGNPFPAGYRDRDGRSDHWADWGRQKGDSKVKDGDTVVIEVAWTDEMPNYTGYAWTVDGKIVTAPEGTAAQEIKILGKEADAVRAAEKKAKDEADAKAKKEAEKQAKEDAAKAKKEADQKAKDDAKAKKDAERREKAEKGIQKSVVPDGLQKSVVETPHGRLTVYLPDDMAAGDTISGTVVAEPAGKTSEEKAKNESELSGYVVEIEGGQKASIGDGKLKFLVPAAGAILLSFKSRGGKQAGATEMPVQLPPIANRPKYGIPKAGQNGRPVRIPGVFDPSQPTRITVGGQEAVVLAESPRQSIFLMPRDLAGPQTLSLADGAMKAEGQIGAVRLSLSAPKTNLVRGESTTVKVRIEGLQPLSYAGDRLEVYFDPAYTIVQNLTADVIEFFGPGSEPFSPTLPLPPGSVAFRIRKADVSSEGVFEKTLQIRAKQAGGFSISASFLLDGDFDGISRPTAKSGARPPGMV